MGRPKLHSWELQYEEQVKSELEKFRPALLAKLAEFAAETPPGVKCLNFEIQSSYYDFPATAFAMDEENVNQVFDVPSPWSGAILPGYKGDFVSEELQESLDSYEALAIFTAEFLGDCWQEAIGKEYPIPVLANHHDRQHYFDCRKNIWR